MPSVSSSNVARSPEPAELLARLVELLRHRVSHDAVVQRRGVPAARSDGAYGHDAEDGNGRAVVLGELARQGDRGRAGASGLEQYDHVCVLGFHCAHQNCSPLRWRRPDASS